MKLPATAKALIAICLSAVIVGHAFSRQPKVGELPIFDGMRMVPPSDDDYDTVRLRQQSECQRQQQKRDALQERRLSEQQLAASQQPLLTSQRQTTILMVLGVVTGLGLLTLVLSVRGRQKQHPPSQIYAPANNANLMGCPDCGQAVSRRAASCPRCGRPLTPKQDATPPP